jgi:sporulation protein YqfC
MMRNKKDHRRPATLRDMSDSILPAVPLIEIADGRRVLIEHHRGVIAYGSTEICVRVSYGTVSIRGSGLLLARMTKEQLVICGCVETVSLLRNRGSE